MAGIAGAAPFDAERPNSTQKAGVFQTCVLRCTIKTKLKALELQRIIFRSLVQQRHVQVKDRAKLRVLEMGRGTK